MYNGGVIFFSGIVFMTLVYCFLYVINDDDTNVFPINDLIMGLPGQIEDVPFRQFGGYIYLDEDVGDIDRGLFYYFVEAETDFKNKPLTIWLTGGPGCSSVGYGFISVGPFIINNTALSLEGNPFSWNKVSNLLFIDSPFGVGWSYSNKSFDYPNTDNSTTTHLLTFLQKWYKKYPYFKLKDLYLAGSNYAGHFVPNLANVMLLEDDFMSNLRGVILENPMLRKKLDILARVDLFFSLQMISSDFHRKVVQECTTINENNYFDKVTVDWPKPCSELLDKAPLIAFRSDNIELVHLELTDVFRVPCLPNINDLATKKVMTKVIDAHKTKVIDGVDMCAIKRSNLYFNLPEVSEAFHGNRIQLKYPWSNCFSKDFKYNHADEELDMLPAIKRILEQSVPITIFSGEQDGIVPAIGTLKHLKKLAEDMDIKWTKEAWRHDNKYAGQQYLFGDLLTFTTIKGANHHVTLSTPSQAFSIFSNFTISRSSRRQILYGKAEMEL